MLLALQQNANQAREHTTQMFRETLEADKVARQEARDDKVVELSGNDKIAYDIPKVSKLNFMKGGSLYSNSIIFRKWRQRFTTYITQRSAQHGSRLNDVIWPAFSKYVNRYNFLRAKGRTKTEDEAWECAVGQPNHQVLEKAFTRREMISFKLLSYIMF